MSGCAPALEWRGSLASLSCHEDVETMGLDLDAEHRRPRYAGAVGGVGEEVTETGEPEQAVGPGVLAECQLEVGQRAVRCGEGDTPARGARHALAPAPAIEGADESDGGQAEDARPDGQGPDVVGTRAHVMGGDGLVDIVWTTWGGSWDEVSTVRRHGGHRRGAAGVIGVRGRVGLLAGMRCLCALW